jgi:hypothetical protein
MLFNDFGYENTSPKHFFRLCIRHRLKAGSRKMTPEFDFYLILLQQIKTESLIVNDGLKS